jgi:acetate kinase
MEPDQARILIINGGSSSIKFALYRVGSNLERELHGQIERIGQEGAMLSYATPTRDQQEPRSILVPAQLHTAEFLMRWLAQERALKGLCALGHRVVHGMDRTGPEVVTSAVLDELRRSIPCDPEHMSMAIDLIEACGRQHPELTQIVCYDTSFHCGMPLLARVLPLPRRLAAKGVRRYGFHGLSYAYLMEELQHLQDSSATHGRVILAHLGNGASLAAIRDGRSIDTSMGFTPNSGLPMGTRSGDIEPGIAPYLALVDGLDADGFQRLVTHEAGLLGISETSSDMRDLLARQLVDVRAAEAVCYFCYQAKKWIGAYAAALGGLDTLVFSGGIGESSPEIRAKICSDLAFLGIVIDDERNGNSAGIISAAGAPVTVRVIATNEELMIARSILRLCPLAAEMTA